MVEKRMCLLEELTGTGEVYTSDDWLARVRYCLIVRQEVLATGPGLGGDELAGLRSTRGEIEVVSGKQDLAVSRGGPYSLHLSDGRTWDFCVTGRTPDSALYHVASATGTGPYWARNGDRGGGACSGCSGLV